MGHLRQPGGRQGGRGPRDRRLRERRQLFRHRRDIRARQGRDTPGRHLEEKKVAEELVRDLHEAVLGRESGERVRVVKETHRGGSGRVLEKVKTGLRGHRDGQQVRPGHPRRGSGESF